mgnify:CR=1 FL=1
MSKVAIIGLGYLGTAYSKVFSDAVLYDEPKGIGAREEVNKAEMAIVAVPTDSLPSGYLDMSIVEEIIDWLETPLILIKSALMPGTVDRLIEKTGKKIAVSVEYIGMGNYYLDPSKYPDPLNPQRHKLLVVGGETKTAEKCAGILWSKMSPETRIHIVTAKEAEICKLIENAYGALKVTFANCLYSLCEKTDTSFIRTHQAWSEDGRTDPMHTRVVERKRGWKSHCYDKDIQALQNYASNNFAFDMSDLFETIIKINKEHLKLND